MTRGVGVTELLRETLPEWSVPLFEFVALLGDELLVGAVLLLLACTDAYRSFRHGDDRLLSDRTAFVLAVVLGGLAFTLALKSAFGLPRPPASLRAIPKETPGFPSGHTMAATVCWTALALWSTRWTRRRRLALAAVPIGLVAVSRLALGVHYLVDVVASIGFGVGYLILAATLTGKDPTKAFAGAAILGVAALVVTGGTTDGWLAFVGCLGGAVGWWVITRPTVRELWVSASS
ncbi:phosphatase PAP2 family protein [Halobiforma lacisalsi AJ5]|uniref:PA-phosphatase-like phosphoesterase n=2 Tax=Natronobacterium TaxID=2256 RepID=M0L5D9_NATLA|nr:MULTISPECIES: phosphatase PAP2 family protein [Halobiforma]APW98910.1 phosphatase PAP2 family protein [Halobiforma lacisalsi AJ5]EMA27205.1 PA-phosphatase-like phosphoesterase [Halobiforma lacisalsi AJ5]SFC72580.1 PAP2 superfamily protein [Halobiforma haloterrestris]